MKLLKITFWTALIIGIVFFPVHMLMLAIFLFLIALGIGFLGLLIGEIKELFSLISRKQSHK